MLNDYKANVGKGQYWKVFSSVTRQRKPAEQYGNALFIIQVVQIPLKLSYWTAVSEYSQYPDEYEVLLPAAVTYVIKNVKYDNETKTNLIYVTV
jgi:hypothetical protein